MSGSTERATVYADGACRGNPGMGGYGVVVVGDGFYEVNCRFGGSVHRVLLPMANTVLIAKDREERFSAVADIER